MIHTTEHVILHTPFDIVTDMMYVVYHVLSCVSYDTLLDSDIGVSFDIVTDMMYVV
jgi:hypothetical protein